ncbi:LexA family protein [Syntrophomonas curvata]
MDMKDIIKTQRGKLKLTYEEIGNYVGVGKSTVKKWESGYIANMRRDKIQKLAEVLQVTPGYLMGWESNVVPVPLSEKTAHIPVLGSIPAGVAIEAVEDIIEYIDIPEGWTHGQRQYFGLLVKGDSMFPEYLDGDIVIVRKQSCCESGDDCAVMVNDTDATLKKVRIYEDGLELEAINPMYGKKKFTNEEVKYLPVSILGVVVELRRKK